MREEENDRDREREGDREKRKNVKGKQNPVYFIFVKCFGCNCHFLVKTVIKNAFPQSLFKIITNKVIYTIAHFNLLIYEEVLYYNSV